MDTSLPRFVEGASRRVVGALALGSLATAVVAQSPSTARIELEPPGDALVGEPIAMRATGLPADVDVVLFSGLVDRQGRQWVGESTFRSTAEGVVDPALQAPIDGAWEGIDARGPFWTPARKTKGGPYDAPADGKAERIVISALVDGQPLATASALRWFRRPGVEELLVDVEGLVARMFVGPGDDPKRGVIVVPGSGGGLPTQTAEQLASRGYASLALAYFGEPGLPADLESVPLEYVDLAIDWFRAHPRVDAERVALMGGLKGGELTFVVGSRRTDLRALVPVVPSSVVFQSIADHWPRTSSWSVGGEDLPFVPYVVPTSYRETGRLSLLYEESLKDREVVEHAAIAVERAGCPILMITGRDDWVWPATAMCSEVVARLEASEFPYEFVHLAYDDVGHEVLAPGYRPVSWSPRVGGTRQGHAAAQADAWAAMLGFLTKHLGPH
jgi:dienelactone hydrolase